MRNEISSEHHPPHPPQLGTAEKESTVLKEKNANEITLSVPSNSK
jgi:hypothetical protein